MNYASINRAELYGRVLEIAGYEIEPATEKRVRACFADYVDAGIWRNIDLEDVADIDTWSMCVALLRLKNPRSVQREVKMV
jgi:hypothetical protein